MGALLLSGEYRRFFVGVAICGRAIEFDRSACLPTSLTQQSNNDDVGNGHGKEVAGNKEGNGNGDEGGGQATATTRAMATATEGGGQQRG
jgi:hypothetical protein